MGSLLLEENRLYSETMGAELCLSTARPTIEPGKEFLLVSWDEQEHRRLLLPRPSTQRDLQSKRYTVGIRQPRVYGWAFPESHDRGVFLDYARKPFGLQYETGVELQYEHAVAEDILDRVLDYDPSLHGGQCAERIEEIRFEAQRLHMNRRQLHEVNSILNRAEKKLKPLLAWQHFVTEYQRLVGSSCVDERAARQLMVHATETFCIRDKSIYLGFVPVGKANVLVYSSQPAGGKTDYVEHISEGALFCRVLLTNTDVGKRPPTSSVIVRKTRDANAEQQLWIRSCPKAIKSAISFSSSNDVNVWLVDPPSQMYIGDIRKEKEA